jgi:D-glycero-alpha-D-manno-heptose-7-phosphate kinase
MDRTTPWEEHMIISRTPFRVSLVGGGSDMVSYHAHTPGRVLSFAIDSYMYVTVSPRFDSSVRVAYTQTEIVDDFEKLQHGIIREAMRMTGVCSGVEITTIANIFAGSGLGSSSSLAIGTLHALHAYRGDYVTKAQLCEQACRLEIEVLGKPIGKQDQYAAGFGGLNVIQFNPDGTVFVEPVACPRKTREELQNRLLMFHTEHRGDNDQLLERQSREVINNMDKRRILDEMVALVDPLVGALTSGNLPRVGELLHENWLMKRQLTTGIANERIDTLYEAGLAAGARGGKLLGAGGGGFLLFYCEESGQESLRQAMDNEGLQEFHAGIEMQGSTIVHYD